MALLSTLPERLLRRSGGSIPEGMTFRPSHSTSPFVVAAGSFQEVLLKPTRWEVTVRVSGLDKASCADFEPWAFSPMVNYTVAGRWENQSACTFSVLPEASGPWVLGLRRRQGAGESAVPLGTVDIPEGSAKKGTQLAVAVRSVEGKVVDAAGNPVPWAEVRLSNSLSCSNRGFAWRGKTDRNGRFVRPAAPAEPLVVSAYRSDLGWAMEERDMDEPLLLRLAGGKQVSLRVLNEEGNPVSAQLQCSPQGAEGLTVGVLDEKGQAVIPHMPTVDGSLLLALLGLDAEAKSLGHFKLFLPAEKRGFFGVFQASPGARVSWWPGSMPSGGAFCALETEDGAILGTDGFEVLTFGGDATRPAFTSKLWERLAPGRFRPVVTDEACKPIWRGKWFVVGPGETVELKEKVTSQ
ncbi:MAG: carboxypeptidase-like regulatory domain-containing protein [Thermoanaerobaculum sp.]